MGKILIEGGLLSGSHNIPLSVVPFQKECIATTVSDSLSHTIAKDERREGRGGGGGWH